LPLVAHDGFDAEPEPGEIPEPSALPACHTAGALFERQLGARISFDNGLFHNLRCRLDDLADSNRVAIRNALQDRSAFGVFGPISNAPLDIGAASVQNEARTVSLR
jgi:hypothetical protein